jgi:hypothetical protein
MDFGIDKLNLFARQGFIDEDDFAIDMGNASSIMSQRLYRDANWRIWKWFFFGSVT